MKRTTKEENSSAEPSEMINKRSRAWLLYLLAGVLATGGYFLLPSASAQNIFYDLIGLSAVAAIGVGLHMHRPIYPGHWYVLAFGLLILAVGDMTFAYYENVLHINDPLPSVADVFYLTGMPCLAAGLLLIQCRSLPGRQWANLVNGLT